MHAQLNIAACHPGCRVLAGLTWVSPNASLDQLDLNALERWTGPRAEKPVVPFDSLLYPDWYAREKHWHPWVPHNQDGLWWHQLSHDNTLRPLDDEVGAKQDLLVMVKILGVIYRRIQPEGPRPDNAYRISELNLSLPHSLDHARRFMLSASGYIQWLKAHRSDDMVRCLEGRLTSRDEERMLAWGLDQPGGVGVILDLTRDQREMNIGLYLRHNIPVYYPWTLSAAADIALYHLSPAYLLSLDNYDTSSVPPPNVDFFFQSLLPGRRGSALTSPTLPPLTHRVLDFQGWTPRSISRNAARSCWKLFYFEEHLVDDGLTQSYLRIYHRFRPNASQEREHFDTDSLNVCIRERWKFDHAPPPGQFYDMATQQLKTAEPTPMQVSSPVHPSWGLMIPPISHKNTGYPGPAPSEVDDQVATDPDSLIKSVVVEVDFGSHSGMDVQIQKIVLRLPSQLHVPLDGGLWSAHGLSG